MSIDLAPLLPRFALSLADLSAPSGTLTETRRAARTRLTRHLVTAGHTGTEIAAAFGVAESTVQRRCKMAGIDIDRVYRTPPTTHTVTDGHVPGLEACAEYDARREDCVHEAACLGRLVAERPTARAARCRPGCERRQALDRDARMRLAMVGGSGYAFPQHG